jgi:CHAT domain-containing protein
VERRAEAAATLDVAQRLIEALEPGGERQRLEATLLLLRGELLAGTDPLAAETVLSTAVVRAHATGHLSQLPRLLLARARANLGRGDPLAAEEDLARAVATLALHRRQPAVEELRIGYFESAQKAYDAMVRFQARVRGDALTAFAFAEEARAQALLDRLVAAGIAAPGEDPPGLGRALSAAGVAEALPLGTTLLEYAVLPEEILIWTLRRGTVGMTYRQVSEQDLCRRVEALRAAVALDLASPDLLEPAASLFDDLLRPVLGEIAAGETLILVPDRCLSRLPFAVLRDRLDEQFLVERNVLAVAPSAAFALAAQRQAAMQSKTSSDRLLAVGNPAFDQARFRYLPDLPWSAEEAIRIGALYPAAKVLLGAEATRERFKAALPGATVLHLAAHAVSEAGEEAAAVLALASDPDDPLSGALSVDELYEADLRDLELAFLSACGTVEPTRTTGPGGAGREGVAGLARAFLAAGVPATVATLWRVDDRTAAELALAFHRHHVAGKTAAAALRAAQVELLSHADAAFRSPAAWGVFQLYGGPAPTRGVGPGR